MTRSGHKFWDTPIFSWASVRHRTQLIYVSDGHEPTPDTENLSGLGICPTDRLVSACPVSRVSQNLVSQSCLILVSFLSQSCLSLVSVLSHSCLIRGYVSDWCLMSAKKKSDSPNLVSENILCLTGQLCQCPARIRVSLNSCP